MKNSKFLSLFRTLDKKEATAFGRHLKKHGPEDGIALTVFAYFRKLHPDFQDEKKLDISYAYQHIFKESIDADEHNRTKILNILSDLHIGLKEYLKKEKLNQDSVANKLIWLDILKERGLIMEYGRQIESLLEGLSAKPMTSIQDYMMCMLSNYFCYYHLAHDKQANATSALVGCANNMDVFYGICRMKIACEMANRQNQLSLYYSLDISPISNILKEEIHLADHLLLKLYIGVYELIGNGQENRFSEIESLLNNNYRDLDADEIHTILSYLYNFASARIRNGDENFWEMTHRLNKFGVQYSIFLVAGAISSNQFLNIVNAGCRANDFTWVNEFRRNHLVLVRKEHQENTDKLAEAMVSFDRGRFIETLTILKQVTNNDLHIYIRSKTLELRCYFETKDEKVDIEDFCFSFEGYLRRHRKPKQEVVEATFNFVQIVKMLLREETDKPVLMSKIEEVRPLYFKTWLLEKATTYKGRYAARR